MEGGALQGAEGKRNTISSTCYTQHSCSSELRMLEKQVQVDERRECSCNKPWEPPETGPSGHRWTRRECAPVTRPGSPQTRGPVGQNKSPYAGGRAWPGQPGLVRSCPSSCNCFLCPPPKARFFTTQEPGPQGLLPSLGKHSCDSCLRKSFSFPSICQVEGREGKPHFVFMKVLLCRRLWARIWAWLASRKAEVGPLEKLVPGVHCSKAPRQEWGCG